MPKENSFFKYDFSSDKFSSENPDSGNLNQWKFLWKVFVIIWIESSSETFTKENKYPD